MKRTNLLSLTLIVCLLGSASLVSCDILKKDAKTDAVSQDQLEEFFLENQDAPFVMFSAFSRVLSALEGNFVDGVTFTPRPGSKSQFLIYDGVIGLDFDYDGLYEVNVLGNVDFPGTEPNLDNGAILNITEVTGSEINGTATADVTAAGPGSAFLEGVGSFGVPGEDPVDLEFTATVNLFQGTILGHADVTWGAWVAELFFEESDFAPYQIRVLTENDEYYIGGDLYY